jgi:type I restriction enzyme S subunit
MSEWQECKLSDFINIKHGYAFSGSGITTEETDSILVTPGNFYIGGGFKSTKYKYFSGESPEDYILDDGCIVVTMTDLSKEGDTLGYAAKIPKSKTKKYLHNQRIGLVQFLSNGIDKDFLYWLLRTRDYQGFIIGAATGTSVKHTSPSTIKEYVFLLPSFPEQQAIANILSSLDDKIDLLHRQNKTLEAMAETLFRQWFIEEANEDWEDVPLVDFFDFLEGPGIRNWQYTESGTPFINIRLISNGNIDISKASFISDEEANGKYNHFHLQAGDMIVSTSGTLGKNAIVRDYHLPLMLNTSVIRFKPKDGKSHSFMYQYLNSKLFQEHLESAASGSVQANFGPVHLKQMTINIPAQDILSKYLKQADYFYEKIRINQKQIKTLEKLRDNLLPKLMSGEVRVKLTEQDQKD